MSNPIVLGQEGRVVIRGDLPSLLDGTSPRPRGDRPVYFRSVGLGTEDAAVAVAALNSVDTGQASR